MAPELLLSPEDLRQLFRYSPATGALNWRKRSSKWFRDGEGRYTAERSCRVWNTQCAGRPAFSVDTSTGYLRGSVVGRKAYAHRIIWAMQTGAWPAHEIDHLNGDRADNRWCNLRSVEKADNSKNQRLRSTNGSGMMGVWQIRSTGRWRASIIVDGKRISLGCFPSFDEACTARRDGEAKFGFHQNHGRAT
jgi:hypothetical protein